MEQKTALVTGATGAIGRAVAKQLLEDGIYVAAAYHSNEVEAEKMQNDLCGLPISFFKADLCSHDDAKRLFSEVAQALSPIDILVNCAGVEISKLAALTSAAEWDKVISANLNGAFYCTQCAVRQMIPKRRGKIINITSIAAITARTGQAAYSASKAGIHALTRVTANEVAGYGICVNAVAPGFIDAGMGAAFSDMADKIPLKRLGSPEDVANLVSFLASGKADYITGAVYVVDGGLSIASI